MLMYRRLPYAIDTSKQISERGELSVSRTNQTKGIKQWVNAVFYCYLVPGYHAHTGCIIHGTVWRSQIHVFPSSPHTGQLFECCMKDAQVYVYLMVPTYRDQKFTILLCWISILLMTQRKPEIYQELYWGP